jgi:hypothetical protein
VPHLGFVAGTGQGAERQVTGEIDERARHVVTGIPR